MSPRSTNGRQRGDRASRSSRATPFLIGAGLIVVLLGAAAAYVLVPGRPRVTVSTSAQGLVHVQVAGFGTTLDGVRAVSNGRSVALAGPSDALVPVGRFAQGQLIQVTAIARRPSWLGWLGGSKASAAISVQTPVATPLNPVALASTPGRVSLTFPTPVTVVSYRVDHGPAQVLRFEHPVPAADVRVPSSASTGTLQIAVAPRPWEEVSPATTVRWFVVPPDGGAVALADPAPRSTDATPNGAITLTFAQPVTAVLGGSTPTIAPAVAGTWSRPGSHTLVFTPSGFGFGPGTAVTVGFSHPVSLVAANPSGTSTTPATSPSTTYGFTVARASMVRLEQILAQLGYLPLTFVPAPGVSMPSTPASQVAAMTRPPAGTFRWRWASTPLTLRAQWNPAGTGPMVKGALMAFDADHFHYDGYRLKAETASEIADSSMWRALLFASIGKQSDSAPYSYVYVTKTLPETLTLWQNGAVVLTSPANTGITAAPTADGTYPVYLRYVQNRMKGTNPDGTTYNDLVNWISYFHGGDAVHAFERGSYGTPQSLGCVELPDAAAAVAFHDLSIGDLVTVAN